jgi:hypothetical protein
LSLHSFYVGILSVVCLVQSVKAADSIVTEGVISAPVASVWNAWTTSSGLEAWLAPHAHIDLRIVGMGFGQDEESQRMRSFFEKGNAFTLDQLQKHFSR